MSDIFKTACAIAMGQKIDFDLMHERLDKELGSPEHERSRMEDEDGNV